MAYIKIFASWLQPLRRNKVAPSAKLESPSKSPWKKKSKKCSKLDEDNKHRSLWQQVRHRHIEKEELKQKKIEMKRELRELRRSAEVTCKGDDESEDDCPTSRFSFCESVINLDPKWDAAACKGVSPCGATDPFAGDYATRGRISKPHSF
ncbi:hypothetical protein BC832DRAFT_565034 [Gaertneriomyces semiglobifer]|nr:hypothetical protein BC832DRAFT_565034 [Gaertneriomyces semiglobifer]